MLSQIMIFNIKWMKRSLLVLVILFGSHSSSAGMQQLATRLQQDVRSGRLTQARALAYELMAIRSPESLPAEYQGLAPTWTRRTTELKMKAKALLPTLTGEDKKLLASLLYRPGPDELPETLVSPAGLFKIHYTTSGNSAADPAFIEETARTFDYVYDFEINKLGYQPPPSDNNVDGPEYDVYVHNFADYGATTYEDPVPSTPYDDYTSWIEIDNDFSHTPTKGLDGMRVTAAHEFFHMIQIGYRSYQTTTLSSVFLFESCAAWMEDVVFDSVNDYYYYLPSFFKRVETPFYKSDGMHEYGLSIFYHMLTKKYGVDAIRRIWEKFRYNEHFDAMDKALNDYGSNLSTELAEFWAWNVFTGSRADTVNYYPEGTFYPELKPSESLDFSNTVSFSGKNSELVARAFKLLPQSSGNFVLWPTFQDPYSWIYSVAVFTPDEQATFQLGGADVSKSVPSVTSLSEVWVMPVNVSLPTSDYTQHKLDFQFKIEKGKAAPPKNEIISVVPNPFMPENHGQVEIRFRLARLTDDVFLTILTEHGRTVKRIALGKKPDGLNKCMWDGRGDNGELVVSGVYLFYVEADGIIGPSKLALIR